MSKHLETVGREKNPFNRKKAGPAHMAGVEVSLSFMLSPIV